MKNALLFSGLLLASLTSLKAQGSFSAQKDNPLLRENKCISYVDTINLLNDPLIILSNYNSEEVLVVVADILGNEIYSKIVFRNQCAVLKAVDPYNRIPSGVYTVIATTRNEIYNQKIVVD
jgi:hypothetical protein